MKRSELIEKIQFYIHGFELTNEAASTYVANLVVDLCEEAGMLPPGSSQDMITVTTMDGKVIGTHFEKYEWEAEDE